MKKLAALNVFAVWLVLAVALGLLSGPAQAYVYDDFAGTGINPSLWVDRGPNYGLFSQPGDGNLYFSDPTGGKIDSLRSYNRWDIPFFVSLQYANLQAVNPGASGEFKGSSVNLWIGYTQDLKANTVAVYECKWGNGYYFRAVKTVDGVKTDLIDLIPTIVNSGWLGINYDGAHVSVMYDDGSGWHEIAMIASFFNSDPYFGVQGYNPYGNWLNFKVEQVQFNPVPLPAGVLLLGSGLLGLAGLGRIFKRS